MCAVKSSNCARSLCWGAPKLMLRLMRRRRRRCVPECMRDLFCSLARLTTEVDQGFCVCVCCATDVCDGALYNEHIYMHLCVCSVQCVHQSAHIAPVTVIGDAFARCETHARKSRARAPKHGGAQNMYICMRSMFSCEQASKQNSFGRS